MRSILITLSDVVAQYFAITEHFVETGVAA